MKREERNLQSRQKILDTALKEFAAKGYGLSSINTICEEGGISKGILYHYFKDKDDLYLFCVRSCFDTLISYLEERLAEGSARSPETYFDARLAFFEENPLYQRLFCDALFSPPTQIQAAIEAIKADFNALNRAVLADLLGGIRLRADINQEQAMEVIRLFQDFINAQVQMKPNGEYDLAGHEQICSRALSILLYGAVERKDENTWRRR